MASAIDISKALRMAEGNVSRAAAIMGMSRYGFYSAVKRCNLNPDTFRPTDRATGSFVVRADECIDELPELDAELVDPEIEAAIAALVGE